MDRLPASLWSPPDKEGELVKRGHRVKNWKQRVFRLKGQTLFYFKKAAPTPQGLIHLQNASVSRSDKGEKLGMPHCFEIVAPLDNRSAPPSRCTPRARLTPRPQRSTSLRRTPRS